LRLRRKIKIKSSITKDTRRSVVCVMSRYVANYKSSTTTKQGDQMQITHVAKTDSGEYTISSLPCPACSVVFTTEITGEQLFKINNNALIQDVGLDLTPDQREQFISGYCGTCWTEMFSFDDEEDEEED
jgi:hypothetical protein